MRTTPPTSEGLVFHGARLELCGTRVMVVIVHALILADVHACQLLVHVFHARSQQTIVLMAQDEQGVPTYYGPLPIAQLLARMPFESIPWRTLAYRPVRPSWSLPLPTPTDQLPPLTSSSFSPDFSSTIEDPPADSSLDTAPRTLAATSFERPRR